jgi:hypothetical protein
VETRTSETASWDNWYITATGTDGETYAVNVVTEIAEQPITITIRGVSDESAMHNEIQSDLTPNDFLAPVATTWQQDSTGFAAVVDGNTTFTTNDDAALGVLSPVTNGAAASAGIQNDNSSNFVSLLVDNLLTESNGGELTEASLIQQAKEQSDLELDIDFDEETINYDFRYLDLVNPQDGNAVVTANGNVTIYWPYPEGITYENAGDYAFQVLHYKGMDRTYTVDNTDPLSDVTVEKLDAEATENGISFTTSSFCPFVLMWSANEDPDGQDPDGQDPDEQDPDGQDPDGQDPDGQDPDGQDPDEQDPDNQGSDNQGSDNQGSDNQGSDNQGSDNQDSSNQGSSNRGSGSRGAGKHSATYRGTNTNNVTETTVTQPTGTAVTESGTGTTGRVPNMLNGKNGSAYIMGYPDGSVKPLANISRAEVATIFFRLLKDEVRDANLTERNAFTDVSQGDWYNATISTMAALGIVRGRSEEIFDPNADITRAEFAAICSRFDNTAVETDPNTFSDISGNWAEGEILRVAALGWMKGYPDGTFAPEQSITRAEAVTVINRILQRASELKDQQNNMNTWWDNMDPEKWYYMDMQMAANSYDYQS